MLFLAASRWCSVARAQQCTTASGIIIAHYRSIGSLQGKAQKVIPEVCSCRYVPTASRCQTQTLFRYDRQSLIIGEHTRYPLVAPQRSVSSTQCHEKIVYIRAVHCQGNFATARCTGAADQAKGTEKRMVVQHILVMRGGAIGDVILTLPALGALRHAFPRASLAVMGNPGRLVLAQHPAYADAAPRYRALGSLSPL